MSEQLLAAREVFDMPAPILLFSPLEADRMARREWQNPSVLVRESAAGPEWYVRYRVKVMEIEDGKPVVERVEKWRALGLCATMTKRQAEREKDKILREVNQQVYTVQSQFPFMAFVKVFEDGHLPTLAVPTQNNYRQQLRQHITPAFKDLKLSQIGPMEIQQLFSCAGKGQNCPHHSAHFPGNV